ncbi:MAG TPA: sulfite exporter TauE/SafE family protein [Burkholderiales bacterium]|nr:sulfite exporter TauE/SafE family protein [Burkholderiales bacterium]
MEWWVIYLVIGAAVGFLAGLLGIGGGMVMVPVLVFVFTAKGFSSDNLMHLSLATAMATIPFTSASSVRAHHVRDGVDWGVVLGMLPGLALGALLGALVAGAIPSRPLAIFFTVFIFYAAFNMFRNVRPKATRQLPGRLGLGLAGGVVSFLASFVAAGAAFMTIPFMTWCNVPLKRAIGTAAALGFPLALASTAGYVYAGWRAPGLPDGTLGFVYLPALGLIVATSVLTAPLGARLSHRLPVHRLRVVFGLLLLALALRMLSSLW